MKIKTKYVLFSMFLMLLPLLVAYVFISYLQGQHKADNFEELFRTEQRFQQMTELLQQPEWIEKKELPQQLKKNATEKIYLFNAQGKLLDATVAQAPPYVSVEQLYRSLYETRTTFRTMNYREPIFKNREIVGFFQIEKPRKHWIEKVKQRTWVVGLSFVLLLMLLAITANAYINRLVNHRLTRLASVMDAYAHDDDIKLLRPTNDEIGKLEQQFLHMHAKLEETKEQMNQDQQLKDEMIAGLSHDLKTPLAAILLQAEALQMKGVDSSGIIDQVGKMKKQISDLMMFASLQSPNYAVEKQEVQTNELFDMVFSDYEWLDQPVLVHCTSDQTIKVAPQHWVRMIDNLMDNARKFSTPESEIVCFAVDEGQALPENCFNFVKEKVEVRGVTVGVQNAGAGLTATQLERIMRPFYQVSQTRSSGVGLGLSIVQALATQEQATVQAYSEIGTGTCFIIQLKEGSEC